MDAPQHALEWIAQHGRYMRSIALTRLRRRLKRARGQCTWCAGAIPRGRLVWCSNECRDDAWQRCLPQVARAAVERRDRGVCSECGLDTTEVYAALLACLRALQDVIQVGPGRRYCYRDCTCLRCVTRREFEDLARWEADHIVPVVLGGGLCGPDGLRTACLRCHKGATKRLAALRKALREEV